jgi:hypothetical protein
MRPRSILAALAAFPLLVASPVAAQGPPFEPSGELRFHGLGFLGTSASFDDERLIGPTVNLTRREDGTWAGDLAGQNMDLQVSERRVTGPNVSLTLAQKGGRTEVEGLFFNQRFRMSVDAKRLHGRFGECSFDMVRKRDAFRGDLGCLRAGASFPSSSKATLTLIGTASQPAPPLPQFVLALVAILPR